MYFINLLLAVLLQCSFCLGFNGPSDPKRFKFYQTPSYGGICDGDSGPDGETLWYQDLIRSRMGVINYKTGKIKEVDIPYSKGPHGTPPFVGNVSALQCVVRLGKDGFIYGGAGTRNEIVRVNPRTMQLKVYGPNPPRPFGNLLNFNDAWAADEGLFFSSTTGNTISLFDYKTLSFTFYRAHTPLSGPLGMRTDKYNNLWFTNFFGQFLSKFDNKTKTITEYKNCCPLPFSAFPEVLRSSTENQRYLWANAFGAGGFIRMDVKDPNNPKFKTFTNPQGQGTFPFENDNDYCGRVWYTSPTFPVLAYYDPKVDKWTNIKVPSPLPAGTVEVIMHRGPGHYMWFCELSTGRLGRYTLDPSCQGEPE